MHTRCWVSTAITINALVVQTIKKKSILLNMLAFLNRFLSIPKEWDLVQISFVYLRQVLILLQLECYKYETNGGRGTKMYICIVIRGTSTYIYWRGFFFNAKCLGCILCRFLIKIDTTFKQLFIYLHLIFSQNFIR